MSLKDYYNRGMDFLNRYNPLRPTPDAGISEKDSRGTYIYWQVYYLIGAFLTFIIWLVYIYLAWKWFGIYGWRALIALAIRAAIPTILYGHFAVWFWYEFFRKKSLGKDGFQKGTPEYDQVRAKRTRKLLTLAIVWFVSIFASWFLIGIYVNIKYFGEIGWVFEILFGSVFLGIGMSFSYLVSRLYDASLKEHGRTYALRVPKGT